MLFVISSNTESGLVLVCCSTGMIEMGRDTRFIVVCIATLLQSPAVSPSRVP